MDDSIMSKDDTIQQEYEPPIVTNEDDGIRPMAIVFRYF